MLEYLDQIDWQQFGYHVYGEHERIPDWIRALLSPDAETRGQARDFLLGAQQDFGDIYDTTPHLVPFIIELLANDDTPGKAELLAHLGGVAENIYSYTHSSASLLGSIHQMRLVLNTYEAFSQARQIFIRLLESDDATLRCASAELMQYLTADVAELLPPLMQQFEREEDTAVSVSLMKCLKTLFASIDWRHSELYELHTPFIQEVLTSHPEQTVRVATARTAVEFARRYDWKIEQIFPTAPGILAQEFLDLAVPLSEAERVEPLYHQQCIVQELAQLGFEPLLQLLHHPALTADQAHLVARGVLAFAFHCSRPEHWRVMPAYGFSEYEVRYVYELTARDIQLPRQRDAIKAIVDAEKVWERPTNLFSFFYGLPDTRDELRILLADSD